MKSSYFLVGMTVVGFVTANIRGIDVERPEGYQILDNLISSFREHQRFDWPAIFHILDSMKGIISVNEYRTNDSQRLTLLGLAVIQHNHMAVNSLLEKYKANPNTNSSLEGFWANETPLMIACMNGDPLNVKLLLKYGADPYLKSSRNINSFDYAKDKPEILRILKEYKKQ